MVFMAAVSDVACCPDREATGVPAAGRLWREDATRLCGAVRTNSRPGEFHHDERPGQAFTGHSGVRTATINSSSTTGMPPAIDTVCRECERRSGAGHRRGRIRPAASDDGDSVYSSIGITSLSAYEPIPGSRPAARQRSGRHRCPRSPDPDRRADRRCLPAGSAATRAGRSASHGSPSLRIAAVDLRPIAGSGPRIPRTGPEHRLDIDSASASRMMSRNTVGDRRRRRHRLVARSASRQRWRTTGSRVSCMSHFTSAVGRQRRKRRCGPSMERCVFADAPVEHLQCVSGSCGILGWRRPTTTQLEASTAPTITFRSRVFMVPPCESSKR